MDPTGIGVAVVGILASKDIMNKLLGPTADYIGGEMKNLVEKCNINLDVIFNKAIKKVDKKLDNEYVVNPRILKGIIDEGRFCEEELVAEYFSGILASSRSTDGRDDRCLATLALVKNLSRYQLRFHYLCYEQFSKLFKGKDVNVLLGEESNAMRIFIPFNAFREGMDLDEHELIDADKILFHAINGLYNYGLINPNYCYGSIELIKNSFKEATTSGVIVGPSPLGVELFLSVFGYSNIDPNDLFSEEIILETEVNIKISDIYKPEFIDHKWNDFSDKKAMLSN